MKRVYGPCLLILFLCLAVIWSLPACGMNAQAQTQMKDIEFEKRGRYAEEMTGRIPDYEVCGDKMLELIENSEELSEWKDSGVVFGTVEDALSFGRYFYRYIYLGKQEIRMAVGENGDRAVVYVQCDDPHQAAIQHRQTEDRLYDIVAEGAGMAEREKASFFYEWVYSKVEYDTELKRKTVYEAVMEGRSVCWGYVSAYLMLCRMAGMDCEPVYGGGHAWNRVWIDGGWKHCDITWDKSTGLRRWKLVPEAEMEEDPIHRTFLKKMEDSARGESRQSVSR